MKIVKINENLLKEADGQLADIKVSSSVSEIADEIQDQSELAGARLSDEQAQEAAELAKEAGSKIGAEEVVIADDDAPLDLKNRLTDALDDALEDNLGFKEDGINEVANVLVSGLPGSSKTATVYNWAARARANGGPVHITYLNAKNNDIEAFINGYTVQDPEDKLSVRQAVSHNLDGLDRPNSILFLDEYNRQTKDQIRASLLTLINEHYVTGREESGKHYFKNFLFTIAAINPAGSIEDEGAAMMNDAERSRFLYKITDFDSDKTVTKDYLAGFYLNKAKKEAAKSNPDWAKIERFLRIWHLGVYICDSDDFEYDKKDKLNRLFISQSTMLNQRVLTAALAASRGNVDKFKRYIDNSSKLLPENIEAIDEILEDYKYIIPTLDQLLKSAGISQAAPKEEPKEDPVQVNEVDPNVAAEEEEDDDDFFVLGNNNGNNSGNILTPNEVRTKINDQIANW